MVITLFSFSPLFFFLQTNFLYVFRRHLPAYLVAAFIKRFSRLALFASPPPCACVCVAFVLNLLVRHPACAVMADREGEGLDSDPFRDEENDPAKANGLDSMLWEIKVGDGTVLLLLFNCT
jgi:U3 small nucleolar RNA-associated protein 19